MTVCIGAIFQWVLEGKVGEPLRNIPSVIIASDRMLTAGDLEYQSQMQKIGWLTNNIAVSVAGDIVAHSESVMKTKRAMTAAHMDNVGEAAEVYASNIREYKRKQAEHLYLSPLGLDGDAFLARQKQMSPEIVSSLINQLQSHEVSVSAIVAGQHGDQAHLYVVDEDGLSSCHDDLGFACIGIGGWHSKSYLTFIEYSPHEYGYAEALFSVFAAKKRAEAAPGVGENTDIVIVCPDGPRFINKDQMQDLKEIYEEQQNEEKAALKIGVEKLFKRMEQRSPDLFDEGTMGQSQPDSVPVDDT